jgi:hypothetical protein
MDGIMKTYKTYVFRNQDPIIDELRTIVQASGLKRKQITDCGVSSTTISNWFGKKTKRPQFATISAVALTCGAEGIRFVDGKPEFVMPSRRLKVVQGGKR